MARGRPRGRSRLRRNAPQREPYDRVLIVCEDAKAAPAYFRELTDRYRLSTANVAIVGSGSDPRFLVRNAKSYERPPLAWSSDYHRALDRRPRVAPGSTHR